MDHKTKYTFPCPPAVEEVTASLVAVDPNCPKSVDEIQQEFKGALLPNLVRERQPLIKLQMLQKLLLESDEFLDKMIEKELAGKNSPHMTGQQNDTADDVPHRDWT